jgi:shikimate kinase
MNEPDRVALIGFMTSGKSSIGPQLAMRLDLEFLDLDREVVERAGRSVAEIFATQGEPAFREFESQALDGALSGPANLVSTGGGTVERESNRRRLVRAALVVWLDVRFDTVCRRLEAAGEPTRPLVARLGLDGLRALHQRRRPLYASCAHLRIDADRDAPGRLARRIAVHVQRRFHP